MTGRQMGDRAYPAGRADLLARIEDRVERYAQTRDRDAVDGDDAVRDAEELLAAVGWSWVTAGAGTPLDSEAVLAVAWFYWYRADIPDTPDISEISDVAHATLERSITLFTPLYEIDPDLLPPMLRDALADEAAPVSASQYYQEYLETGDPAALDRAVDQLRSVIQEEQDEQDGSEVLGRALTNLAAVLRERFLFSGDPEDLADAVEAGRGAVCGCRADDPELPARWSNLGAVLLARFDTQGRSEDLDEAVVAQQKAVRLAADDDDGHPVYLANLAAVLLTRLEQNGLVGDGDAAITAAREAVQALPTGAERAAALSTLGRALALRSGRTGETGDLDEAIDVGRTAVAEAGTGTGAASAATNLASSLSARWDQRGNPQDLREAGTAGGAALKAAPSGGTEAAMCSANLATIHWHIFEGTSDEPLLDSAVNLARAATDSAGTGSPYRAGYLATLAAVLHSRFERIGRQDDLTDALTAAREAVETLSPGHPDHPRTVSILALALQARAARSGDVKDLDDAVALSRAALAVTDPQNTFAPSLQINLATVLRDRFVRRGDLDDLDQAVEYLRGTAEGAPSVQDRTIATSNLCAVLGTRFEMTGQPEDLVSAVAAGRDALAAGGHQHAAGSMRLGNLSAALRARYEALGEATDLEEAVALARLAVARSGEGSPSHGGVLSVLGAALQSRALHAANPADLDADLDDAVAAARAAVACTPDGDPALPGRLSNLGGALQARAASAVHRTPGGAAAVTADLEEAVEASRRASRAARVVPSEVASMASNLCFALHMRFLAVGRADGLDEAVAAGELAVGRTRRDAPDRTTYLTNLALALGDRFNTSRHGGDLERALDSYREAAAVNTASPLQRLAAARWGGRLAASAGRSTAAAEALAQAVRLLPRAAWQGLQRASREDRTARAAGLAGEAAACCLTVGDAQEAVKLLESGRSVLWSQSLDVRTDLSRLHRISPALAGRLTEVARALNVRPEPMMSADAPHLHSDDRPWGVPDFLD
ncbi:hypothetical protein FNH09_09710 [Streptomyces adustus]|uniref:Tetratricopeptide repeat protein n=1 Tax=Streptomyces adustus TaxID=1609272 RepID=A0A5N8V8P8_9ACTN|nr:hypothetical protein [Streptomyces adustus]MPY31547.1 hypothetical protein [Streptomyces adustus]